MDLRCGNGAVRRGAWGCGAGGSDCAAGGGAYCCGWDEVEGDVLPGGGGGAWGVAAAPVQSDAKELGRAGDAVTGGGAERVYGGLSRVWREWWNPDEGVEAGRVASDGGEEISGRCGCGAGISGSAAGGDATHYWNWRSELQRESGDSSGEPPSRGEDAGAAVGDDESHRAGVFAAIGESSDAVCGVG